MSNGQATAPQCIQCNRTAMEVPLIPVEFQNQQYWICTQHLPTLIHNPKSLSDKLPGAGGIEPAKGHG